MPDFLTNILAEASQGANSVTSKPGKRSRGPAANTRSPPELPAGGTQAARAAAVQKATPIANSSSTAAQCSAVALTTLSHGPIAPPLDDRGSPSARETPLDYGAPAGDHAVDKGPLPNTVIHPLPPRPPTPIGDNHRPGVQVSPSPRREGLSPRRHNVQRVGDSYRPKRNNRRPSLSSEGKSPATSRNRPASPYRPKSPDLSRPSGHDRVLEGGIKKDYSPPKGPVVHAPWGTTYHSPKKSVYYIPSKSADEIIQECLKPHPKLLAQQAAAAKAAAEHERQLQRHRARDHYQPAVTKAIRKPKRRSKASYQTMSLRELVEEAEVRGLELDRDHKQYLVDVLVVYDEGYDELYDKLGDHYEALDFAKGEVLEHNKQLRAEQRAKDAAATKLAARKKRAKLAKEEQEAYAKRKAAKEAAKLKEEQETSGKQKAAKEAAKLKTAGEPKTQSKDGKRARKGSRDSGYSTGEIKSPALAKIGEDSDVDQNKGKKRCREDNEDEDEAPSKKTKASPMNEVPHIIKAVQSSSSDLLARLSRAPEDEPSSALSGPSSDTDVQMSDREQKVETDREQQVDITKEVQQPRRQTTARKAVPQEKPKPGTAVVKPGTAVVVDGKGRPSARRKPAPKRKTPQDKAKSYIKF